MHLYISKKKYKSHTAEWKKCVLCEQSFKELWSLRSTVEIHCSSESHKEQSAIFSRPGVSSYPSWHFNLDIPQRGKSLGSLGKTQSKIQTGKISWKMQIVWKVHKQQLTVKCRKRGVFNAPQIFFHIFIKYRQSLWQDLEKSFILYTVRQIPCTLWIAQVY